MTTYDMVIQLCKRRNVSIVDISRRIGQTPQNFNKKIKRNTVSLDELIAIADTFGVTFEQSFLLEDGTKIRLSNKE